MSFELAIATIDCAILAEYFANHRPILYPLLVNKKNKQCNPLLANVAEEIHSF